ncbi:MAG TPA: gamma-glutamyltransferase [Kofleriaceae bacterium]|nr:gamma-glutamyltransferase [Kofleriaceae bacterium]
MPRTALATSSLAPAVRSPRASAWLALALAAAAGASGCKRSVPAERDPSPPATKPVASGGTDTAPATAPDNDSKTGPDDSGAAPVVPHSDVAVGKRGAVTSAEKQATAVGRAILEKGGNAVDAAVAVGLALSVTHPTAGNIGGGGFMVIRFPDGRSTTIDYREVAPRKATRDMYLDDKGNPTQDSRRGPRAAGIPGNVAGWAMAHKKYGSLPWKDLVAPAIALARDGSVLDSFHAKDLDWGVEDTESYAKELAAAADKNPALVDALAKGLTLLRRADGKHWSEGERWSQPELAVTLQAIADGGAPAFYRGPLAAKLAGEVTKMGGLWTAADLAAYRPIERKPIVFDYRGYQIVTMPPPSAGGVTLRQIFAASEALELYSMPWDSVDRIHLYIEALRRVFADRNLLIADPAFVNIPMKTLLDPAYTKKRMADVNREKATPSAQVGAGAEVKEKLQTTHFSVVDGKGMAVANTFTLNGGFGAGVFVPGTGVLLNNEMDDFTAKPGSPNMFGLVQGPQNAIQPGKRMLSSMTPTIVSKGGKLRAVCGSPGGPTIITTVAQILLQVIDYDRPIDKAIEATRIHHQWLPDVVIHEDSLDPAIAKALVARGHVLKSRGRIGHANCIEADPKTGELRAVADVGRDGGDADAF